MEPISSFIVARDPIADLLGPWSSQLTAGTILLRIFLSLLGDPEAPFFHLKLVYEGDALTEAVLNGKPLRIEAPEGRTDR